MNDNTPERNDNNRWAKQIQDAWDEYAKQPKDIDRIEKCFELLSRSDSLDCRFNYTKYLGLKGDPSTKSLFVELSRKGHLPSTYYAAQLMWFDREYSLALEFYQRAALSGHFIAALNLPIRHWQLEPLFIRAISAPKVFMKAVIALTKCIANMQKVRAQI